MGLPLVAFLVVLMAMGWALGLAICGGHPAPRMGAEGLAWNPSSSRSLLELHLLPGDDPTGPGCKPFAWGLPSTYVFEGMRGGHVRGAISAPITC